MTAGIEIFNSAGQKIIDSDMKNVVFKSKSVITFGLNDVFDDRQNSYIAFATVGTTSMVCVSSPSTPVAVSRGLAAPGFGDIRLFANGTSAPTDVTIYVFEPTPVSASGVGLVVYNAAGEPTFSPDKMLMRVLGVASVSNSASGAGLPATTTLSGLGTGSGPYAACLTTTRMGYYYYDGATDGGGAVMMDAVKTPSSNDRVEASQIRLFGTGGPGAPLYHAYDAAGGRLLAVSVAGL